LWDGHLARPDIINRLFELHHKKFWDIFLFASLSRKSSIAELKLVNSTFCAFAY
jgi:hypothetical protein